MAGVARVRRWGAGREEAGEEGVVVEGEKLDGGVQGFGGDLGVAETACWGISLWVLGWEGNR